MDARWRVRTLGGIVVLGVAATAALPAAAHAQVTVSDPSVTEGNSGTVLMSFTIDHPGCYSFATNPGTATAQPPADYESTEGGFTGAAGTDTVTVVVNGDTLFEPDETFTLDVDVNNCSAGFDSGTGTIINDDSPPPPGPPPGDFDSDGVPDSIDACPTVPAFGTPNGCPDTAGQLPDSDGDGVPNNTDSCPLVAASTPSGCPDLGEGMLPPPEMGKTVNLFLLDDDVFIKLPAGFAKASGAGAAQKGQGFVPLIDPRQVPVGSFVDTKDGRVQLVSASNLAGGTQSGKFSAGLFQVLQARRSRAPTVLRLKGSSFRRCGVGAAGHGARAARRKLSSRTLRRLSSNARGRFRTGGRHSAATVRGTKWVTADRCDGTLTKVSRGRVAVRDFRRRRTVVVRAGKSYLAQARP